MTTIDVRQLDEDNDMPVDGGAFLVPPARLRRETEGTVQAPSVVLIWEDQMPASRSNGRSGKMTRNRPMD